MAKKRSTRKRITRQHPTVPAAAAAEAASVPIVVVLAPTYVRSLIDEQIESRVPTSVNATSTNPITAGLPERSGSTSLLALAADLRSVASALASSNESAISLNLSALALVSLRHPELYSSIARYQQHSFARRFSGTFVFGAKIPESEITGFSGFPECDRLLDTFSMVHPTDDFLLATPPGGSSQERYPFGASLALTRRLEVHGAADLADRTKYVTFSVVFRY